MGFVLHRNFITSSPIFLAGLKGESMMTTARNDTGDILQPGDPDYKESGLVERIIKSERRLAMLDAAKDIAKAQATGAVEIAFDKVGRMVISKAKEQLISQVEDGRAILKKIEQAGAEGKLDQTTVDIARMATEDAERMQYQLFLVTPMRFDSHHR